MGAPHLVTLLARINPAVTMEAQHGVRHVLHHAGGNAWLGHAHHRQVRGQGGHVELVDAGPDREQDFQMGEALGDILRRRPCGQIAHAAAIAFMRPDMEGQLRGLLGKQLRPFGAAYRIGLVEKSHGGLVRAVQPSAWLIME